MTAASASAHCRLTEDGLRSLAFPAKAGTHSPATFEVFKYGNALPIFEGPCPQRAVVIEFRCRSVSATQD
jgi:hypothetical protein